MPCLGTDARPRMFWRNDEDAPDVHYGMCCGCGGRVLMYEVIPPSRPEWKREFRMAAHEPTKQPTK